MSNATNDNSFAIRAFGLSRRFGDSIAVDSIDLAVKEGELFSLLGPNGAGKTTTIKMLCCLLRPSGGTATIMGHDVQKDPMAVKQVIDISPQETAIAEHLNAWENLALMGFLTLRCCFWMSPPLAWILSREGVCGNTWQGSRGRRR